MGNIKVHKAQNDTKNQKWEHSEVSIQENYNCMPTQKLFIAVLFSIARKWKQSKCPPINEWINKTWAHWNITGHIKKWYHATTWMNLKNMLSEERHTQKDTCIIQFHLYAVSKVSTPVEMESDCRWIRALFWGWWKCSKTYSDDSCTTLWIYEKISELYISQWDGLGKKQKRKHKLPLQP